MGREVWVWGLVVCCVLQGLRFGLRYAVGGLSFVADLACRRGGFALWFRPTAGRELVERRWV